MTWMGRRLGEFQPLWPAEEKVIDEMPTGMVVQIGPGVPPEDAPSEVRLRASFLRYLALGGCEDCPPPEKGVQVKGAFIEGDGPEGAETRGLDLERCKVRGDLVLFACRVPDPILLRGGELEGSLYLDRSLLCRGLIGDLLEAKGGVFLRGVEAEGEVRLLGARLGSDLDCMGCVFRAEKDAQGAPGPALAADGLEAKGVLLRDVEARGEVRLIGVRLGGDLDCTGGVFRAEKDAPGAPGWALAADGLEANGRVILAGIVASGEVRLLGARLGGDLDCVRGVFRAEKDAQGAPGPALAADRLEAKGDVTLDGVEVRGEVRLLGAKLGSDLSCIGGVFRAEKDAQGRLGHALNVGKLRAKGVFFLREGARVEGVLDLTGAEVGMLADAAEAWPAAGLLLLDRFRYGAIVGGPVDAAGRLDWLGRLDPARWGREFWPQPYEQLAKVLREMGHEDEAKTVLVEKERLLRRAEYARLTKLPHGGWKVRLRAWIANLPRRARHRLATPLLEMVAYGHRPERALWPALGLVLIGWGVVALGAAAGVIEPVPAGTSAARGQAPTRVLVPLAYAFESFVPIVDLGQKAAFRPDMDTLGGWWLQVFLWVHGLLGWLIGGVAAAGVLGLFRRS